MKPSHLNKTPINFRLSHQVIVILKLMEEKLHVSKTEVVEKALQFYADKKLKTTNPLMKHAGVLSEKEADAMLISIKRDRRNKNIKVKL